MTDGCEFDPETRRPCYDDSIHYQTVPAVWLVGHDGLWRLCDSCAALPRFRRLTKRKRITPAISEAANGES